MFGWLVDWLDLRGCFQFLRQLTKLFWKLKLMFIKKPQVKLQNTITSTLKCFHNMFHLTLKGL